MAPNMNMSRSQEDPLEAGHVGFLLNTENNDDYAERVQPKRCMGPVPRWMKKKLNNPFRGEADFVEIEGVSPIEATGADWSEALLGVGGVLCSRARVIFDANNATGAAPWGPEARGAILVAVRGLVSFEEIAHNAAAAGALAIIIVDNEDLWTNDWEMTQTEPGAAPIIPAVLVAKRHADCMCSGRGDLTASISRRTTKLSTRDVAKNMASAYWPF